MAGEKRKRVLLENMPGFLAASLNPWLIKAKNNPERLAFILHRVTGFIIVVYLLAHVIVTSYSTNPTQWEDIMSTFANSLFNKIGEWIVAGAVIYHGLNGIRLLLVEFFGTGIGKPELPKPPYIPPSLKGGQRTGLYIVFALSIIGWMLAGILIFTGRLF
ncbi:Succinate dehydrogenase/fumarate reductase, cytochrome b subunit [Hyperthermus butylicus DSM 5456]|uniref:Succinate dehydrogenase/fumarate reductase, cytochrome b subunit n=1 Tax=Hyperthermus butylicus (strain DSM 5456 / JCM 9403 / PLM1-5) TaxID=415426 RepID=A2BJ66_HYPBU|nr:succinate dehydrogenase, cytochrome b556 subunit [Hyperthermus butylicus]ABM80027.1 Succinate dehydrogenase/fumarate reductase, cytochrome b subunit [Hyperthermus butylicus DSM 5456]